MNILADIMALLNMILNLGPAVVKAFPNATGGVSNVETDAARAALVAATIQAVAPTVAPSLFNQDGTVHPAVAQIVASVPQIMTAISTVHDSWSATGAQAGVNVASNLNLLGGK